MPQLENTAHTRRAVLTRNPPHPGAPAAAGPGLRHGRGDHLRIPGGDGRRASRDRGAAEVPAPALPVSGGELKVRTLLTRILRLLRLRRLLRLQTILTLRTRAHSHTHTRTLLTRLTALLPAPSQPFGEGEPVMRTLLTRILALLTSHYSPYSHYSHYAHHAHYSHYSHYSHFSHFSHYNHTSNPTTTRIFSACLWRRTCGDTVETTHATFATNITCTTKTTSTTITTKRVAQRRYPHLLSLSVDANLR